MQMDHHCHSLIRTGSIIVEIFSLIFVNYMKKPEGNYNFLHLQYWQVFGTGNNMYIKMDVTDFYYLVLFPFMYLVSFLKASRTHLIYLIWSNGMYEYKRKVK